MLELSVSSLASSLVLVLLIKIRWSQFGGKRAADRPSTPRGETSLHVIHYKGEPLNPHSQFELVILPPSARLMLDAGGG